MYVIDQLDEKGINKIVCIYSEICFLYNNMANNKEEKENIKTRLYKIIQMIEELDKNHFNNF